jgi:endonuclease YncB( thermonuclease family)
MRILLIILLTSVISAAKAETLYGNVTIVDGDTIKMDQHRIRLHGIDAPESSQQCQDNMANTYSCGQIATQRLKELIGGKKVSCEVKDTDKYGRLVAVCFAHESNLNEQLVIEGLVVVYRKYSNDYVPAEKIAQRNATGLWKGLFINPWEWRRGARLEISKINNSNECNIKGNISSSGKIYHIPASAWYKKTKINTAKGERWFCSEDDAKAAGWRAPRK